MSVSTSIRLPEEGQHAAAAITAFDLAPNLWQKY